MKKIVIELQVSLSVMKYWLYKSHVHIFNLMTLKAILQRYSWGWDGGLGGSGHKLHGADERRNASSLAKGF